MGGNVASEVWFMQTANVNELLEDDGLDFVNTVKYASSLCKPLYAHLTHTGGGTVSCLIASSTF